MYGNHDGPSLPEAKPARAIGGQTAQPGISEQTYYQWKKSAQQQPKANELADLMELEAENARLKKLLADRLRKENAELKRKLKMD